MEIGIERLTALAFVITGLSHFAAPRAWIRFFVNMRAQGEAAGLLNAYVHMPLGILILAFHWVWTWPGLLVTLIGCGLTLKATLYFVRPQIAAAALSHVGDDSEWGLRAAGIVLLVLGLAVFWMSMRDGGAI